MQTWVTLTVLAKFPSVARSALALSGALVAARAILTLAQPRAVLAVAILWTPLAAGRSNVAVAALTHPRFHIAGAPIVALADTVTVGAVLPITTT